MLLATALAYLLQDVLNRRLLFKQNSGSSTKETITHHFFVSGIRQKKTVDATAKFVASASIVKTKLANIKWIARFYYFRHLYSAEARVYCSWSWVAHRYGQLYLHCSLIYFWVPSSCFCIVISLSLRWNNPVQRCLPVGGRLHYPRRRRWLHALTDRLHDIAMETTTSGNIITQSIIFSFSIKLIPSCILHRHSNITLTHLPPVIAAFASFSSLAFCRAGLFCR